VVILPELQLSKIKSKIKFVAEINNSIYTYLRINLIKQVITKSSRLTTAAGS